MTDRTWPAARGLPGWQQHPRAGQACTSEDGAMRAGAGEPGPDVAGFTGRIVEER